MTEFGPFAVRVEEFLAVDMIGEVPPLPHLFRHPIRATAWIVKTLFGLASLALLLAVIAAIPVINFLALGYLLEVEGRMGRTGKLRYAFPLLDIAPRFGAIVVGLTGWLFPLWLLTGMLADYELIAPENPATVNLARIHVVAVVLVTLHLILALARGGSLGCFLRPLKNATWLIGRLRRGDYLQTARTSVSEFFVALRLKHHFWLGLRGFLGALAWLIVPSGLYAVYSRAEQGGQLLVTFLGGLVLILVLAWVPFLQARFATENRLRAMFELRTVRELFTRSPFCWFIAILVTYLMSLPLYLFKVVLPPDDAMWGVTLVFIMSIYPTRVLAGWAYHRATIRSMRAWWWWRWTWRGLMLPLLFVYVFLLFFTQTFGEHGKRVLFEHHAFLLPVPF